VTALARYRWIDRLSNAALAGHKLAACRVASTEAGAIARSTGLKPARSKNGAAVVVSNQASRPPLSKARRSSSASMPPPRAKRVGIGARPPANPHAEAWIRQGDADALGKGDLYTARLTLDITPAMRARIKVSAFTQGVTVADLLRGLLEREFPVHRRENTP